MLKIVTAPHPILSQKAKPVSRIDKNILKLIDEMKQALALAKDPVGVGLAAPQVAQRLRICIVKPSPKSLIQVFINPKIEARGDASERAPDPTSPKASRGTAALAGLPAEALAKAGKKRAAGPRASNTDSTKLEGCLSLPNIWGDVVRVPTITLSYLDQNGKTHTRKFSGFIATVIQHEMDHLNGVLFPKKVLEQKGKLYKSHKDEKGEDVFEEIEI